MQYTETNCCVCSLVIVHDIVWELFPQFYLSCIIDKVDSRVKSAGVPYVRPLSSGQQSYDSVPAEYPVTEPMPKLSALQQTSGEAVYTTDIPTTSDLLHGAFVLAPQGNAKIVSVDTSAAQVSNCDVCIWT